MIEGLLYFRRKTHNMIVITIRLCVTLLWSISIPMNLNNMSTSGRMDKNRTREREISYNRNLVIIK